MLRSFLVGLLAISATAACSKKEPPVVQPGATAGNVVEVVGQVSVVRGAETRPLTVGATVAGDDVIQTGADGRVTIVLVHNNARWEVSPGTTKKVSESLAWGLAKVDTPAPTSDQSTSAAGRDLEKAGAQTSVSANTEPTPEPGRQRRDENAKDDKTPGAPADEHRGHGAVDQALSPRQKSDPAGHAPPTPTVSSEPTTPTVPSPPSPPSPPPPPPPPPPPVVAPLRKTSRPVVTASPKDSPPSSGGAQQPLGDDGGKGTKPKPETAKPLVAVDLHAILEHARPDVLGCLGFARTARKFTLTLHVASGKVTFDLVGEAATAPMRACVDGVIKKLSLAGAQGDATIELIR